MQQQLLVLCLDQREVTFDAIELWAIRHIIDLCDVQPLKQLLGLLGLVYCKIIQEQRKRLALLLLSKLHDEV